jgi:molecular chaperone DnaK (HSP70)
MEQKTEQEQPRGRILVRTGKRYSKAAVERMIKEYKKRSREDNSKANKYKKLYEKTWARYIRVRESVKKTNKKVWFKIGRERGNHRVSVRGYKKRIENLKIKHKQQQKEFRSTLRKKIYKELKAKFKFYDPNQSINTNYINVLAWARIYAKLSMVKRKTKMTPRDIISILFLSQHENGATSIMFKRDTQLQHAKLNEFTKRLVSYGIVGREKNPAGTRYTYFLTERGWTFANSILNFVKKEKTVVKKIRPKYIRNNVSVPRATASVAAPEQQQAT